VPAALRPWVAEIRVGSGDDRRPLVHLPDTAAALVFRTTAAQRSDLVVVGPRTRASYHAGKALPCWVRLRIRPGRAGPLLGTPVGRLVDRTATLGALWGGPGDRLARELAGCGPDPDRVLAHIEVALLDRVAGRTAADVSRGDLVRAATQVLSARGSQRLPAVAARLHVSERHLRTLFAGEVGLSPKHFARVSRLRSVLRGAGRRGWAQLAADAGYYDQAHMIAEFRAMMGIPPGAYAAGRLPAARSC